MDGEKLKSATSHQLSPYCCRYQTCEASWRHQSFHATAACLSETSGRSQPCALGSDISRISLSTHAVQSVYDLAFSPCPAVIVKGYINRSG